MLSVTALSLLTMAALGEVSIASETYRGWINSYRISNGVVDLVVVPQIGRVMRFGFVGQRNVLWENPQLDGKTPVTAGANNNYGGDKMWPAPQSLWNWPPDPKLDGSVWTAEPIPNGIRLSSPVGGKIKVRFVREITLDRDGMVAHFHNRMDNLGPRQMLAAWQIAQTANPDRVTMPFEPAPGNPKGWQGYGNERLKPNYQQLEAGKLIIKRDPMESRKFGTFSLSGEIIAEFGSTRLRSKSKVLLSQTYVDKNSPLQVYTIADPDNFVEVEHTSPLTKMENGESTYLDVNWRLEVAP